MIKKKLFIFDLDGTLADAYRAIEKSLNFTLKKIGRPPVSYEKVKRKVGRGDRIFMETFFSQDEIEKALKIYRTHHKKSIFIYSRLMPYAKKMLHILKLKKKTIAIASNRPQRFTELIIKKLKIKKYFNGGIWCADRVGSIKPNPKILYAILKKLRIKKEEAIYIGDMAIDLETAKRARIDFIFIKGGSSSLGEVKQYKNKRVISSLSEILKLYG
jgi:phosphoglycolate phosphatase